MKEKLNQYKVMYEKRVKRIERYEMRLKEAREEYIEEVTKLAFMLKAAETENEKRALEQFLLDAATDYAEKEKRYKEVIERTKANADELSHEIKFLESELIRQ